MKAKFRHINQSNIQTYRYLNEEYLETGFYKLCHYFPIKNKRLRAIAILSIHKEYHKGYSDRVWKQWIDKERVKYIE